MRRALSPRGALVAAVTAVAILGPGAGSAAAAPACPYNQSDRLNAAKPNKLYLYFTGAADRAFPEFGAPGAPTSPLNPFARSGLGSYDGSMVRLRRQITDIVARAYCELDVEVIPTLTPPPAYVPRRNVVGIGSDDNSAGIGARAQAADVGNTTAVDSARIWAGRFRSDAGSRLGPWARAVGRAAAYAAAHNYGLTTIAGEVADARIARAAGPRARASAITAAPQFTDTELGLIASNVGGGPIEDDFGGGPLHNVDITNANADDARSLKITFLSREPSLTLRSHYDRKATPWLDPTLAGPLGTKKIHGVVYNVYTITWSKPHDFDGHGHWKDRTTDADRPAGLVPSGVKFHIGADFRGPGGGNNAWLMVWKTELFGADGAKLPQDPPLALPDWAANGISPINGGFGVLFETFGRHRLRVSHVDFELLPRPISLDSMMVGAIPRDWLGRRVRPYTRSPRRQLVEGATLTRDRGVFVPIRRLGQPRQAVERVTTEDCGAAPFVARCVPGMNVSLFPATAVYVRARITDPRARQWDRKRRRYATRPLTTRIFAQLRGFHPDLNRNGTDDFIDIDTRRSADANADGVPDEAQQPPG